MDSYEVGFRRGFVRKPHLDSRPLLLMNDESSGSDIEVTPFLYFSQPPNYKFLLEVSGKKSIVHSNMNGEQGASPTAK